MKNSKTVKIALVTLALTLCIGAAFAMSINATATTTTGAPDIISQNIEYSDVYRIMYAVDSADITGPVTLKVYNEYPTDDSVAIFEDKKTETEYIEQLDKTVYKFTTQSISHLNMTDVFYVTAETETNGVSAVKSYSVAEYLYQRLSDPTASPEQLALYESTVAYGNNLQKVVGNETTSSNLIGNFRYVIVDGGTISEDSTSATTLSVVGNKIEPSAAGVASWNVVLYGAGGAQIGSAIEDVASYQIPDTEGIVGVKFTTSTVITYPKGYITFEDMDTVPSYITQSGVTASIVSDGAHGNVITFLAKTNMTGLKFNMADMPCIESVVSAEDATAVEVSFDIKVVATTNESGSANQYARFNMYNTDGTLLHRTEYKYIYGSVTSPFRINSSESGSVYQNIQANSEGWVNVRIVYYKGDTAANANCAHMHIYINGSEEAFINTAIHSTATAYTGALEATIFNLLAGPNTQDPANVYIDNLFFGYIDAANPYATTTE